MPCLLATGRLFDVVSVEQRLGLEMFDRILRSGLPFGPSLIDRKAQRVGFFLGSQSRDGRLVAATLGLKPVVKNSTWENLFVGIDSGKV
ncbi:hypothetical protein ABT024_40785, partial [Streptomyces sp. NPDC002812]